MPRPLYNSNVLWNSFCRRPWLLKLELPLWGYFLPNHPNGHVLLPAPVTNQYHLCFALHWLEIRCFQPAPNLVHHFISVIFLSTFRLLPWLFEGYFSENTNKLPPNRYFHVSCLSKYLDTHVVQGSIECCSRQGSIGGEIGPSGDSVHWQIY